VIGTVLRDGGLEKQHVIVRSGDNRTAEDYRQLRTNLQFLNVDAPPKVIMVSSAVPAEGKTTVVVNLGLALAESGRRVVIVEEDLRRPKVIRYLGMVGGVGLTNVLAGAAELDEVTQSYGSIDLAVIAAGPTPPNPGELLSSSQMSSLIEKLRGAYDFVLVDAPPLLPVADSSGLAVIMDGVLLSVRHGSTTKEQLRQAAMTLERVGAKTLGVILNIVPPKAGLASAYGYAYSYGTDAESGESRPEVPKLLTVLGVGARLSARRPTLRLGQRKRRRRRPPSAVSPRCSS
jgi:capsular exopolysaccharide synthesis family protein